MMDEISEATQGGAVLENTGDNAIFIKAINRAVGMRVNTANLDEVVIFLEKEIDGYRDKIERLEAYIDGKNAYVANLEDKIEKMKAIPNAARIYEGLSPIIHEQEKIGEATGEVLINKTEFEAAEEHVLKEMMDDPDLKGMQKLLIPLTGAAFANEMGEILFSNKEES